MLLLGLGCTGIMFLLVVLVIFGVAVSNSSSAGNDKGGTHTHPAEADRRELRHRSPVTVPPIDIQTSKNVDERLFLLRLLDELGNDAPDENLPADQLQSALGAYVKQVTAVRDHVRERRLDDELVAAYDKLLGTIDAYTTYLADVGHVEKAATNRLENESYQSGYAAGETGAMAGYAVSENGGSTGQSLAAGGIAALGTYMWDNYQKGKERDDAKNEAVNAARARFSEAVDDYHALCRKTAQQLTAKYVWTEGETGFDESDDYQSTRSSLIQSGNVDGLAQLEQTLQARRPRDPFVVQHKTYFLTLNRNGALAPRLNAAKECLEAVSLVPAGAFYDRYRANLLCTTGMALEAVASREIGNKGLANAFNAEAALGVEVWDAALRYQQDFTGEIREHKAWALFMSGDLPKALKEAEPVAGLRHDDAGFACVLACLYSDLGDADNALTWLRQAVLKNGYDDIVDIKSDPDLATLRAKKSSEVTDLTAVRCTWKLDYGTFNDDMVLTNNSLFALTHITVSGKISPNHKAWKDLSIEALPPGKSYTWSSVVSVPGSKVDLSESSLKVRCDQGEADPDFAQ